MLPQLPPRRPFRCCSVCLPGTSEGDAFPDSRVQCSTCRCISSPVEWSGGRPVALDITVISPQALMVAGAAVIHSSALGVAESCKQALHAATCHRVGGNFLPVAVEVLGGWSPFAATIIHSIGSQAIGHCSPPVSETFGDSLEGQHSHVGYQAPAPPTIS